MSRTPGREAVYAAIDATLKDGAMWKTSDEALKDMIQGMNEYIHVDIHSLTAHAAGLVAAIELFNKENHTVAQKEYKTTGTRW